MNGIHEVTGSIPVWSTNLRSPHFAERGKPTAWRRMAGPLPSSAPALSVRRSRLLHSVHRHTRNERAFFERDAGGCFARPGRHADPWHSLKRRRCTWALWPKDSASARCSGTTNSKSLQNTENQDAVVRNLEIIGEAVRNLPADIRQRHSEVQWAPIAGMRDRLIHQLLRRQLEHSLERCAGEAAFAKKRISSRF